MVGSSLWSLARPSPAATLANGCNIPGSYSLAALPTPTNLGDTALWDADNLDVCAGRWFHAIACHSAPALGQEAIARGVTAFVGYNGLVWAYWQTDAIPLEAQPIVTQILSVVSKHLHQGVHDEQVLRRVIRKAFDAWVRWKNANHRGLRRMKTTFDSQAIDQLLRSLCMGLRLHIRGPAV